MNRSKKLQDKTARAYIHRVPQHIRKHTDKLIKPAKQAASKSGLFVGSRSAKGKESVDKMLHRITFGKPVKRKRRKKK